MLIAFTVWQTWKNIKTLLLSSNCSRKCIRLMYDIYLFGGIHHLRLLYYILPVRSITLSTLYILKELRMKNTLLLNPCFYCLDLVLTAHTKLDWPAKPASFLQHMIMVHQLILWQYGLMLALVTLYCLFILLQNHQKTSERYFKMWPNHMESVTCENWATWTTS